MSRYFLALTYIFFISCKASQVPVEIDNNTSNQATADNSIASFTGSMERYDGYFPFYYDDQKGKLWMEIDKFNTEFLYVNSLPAGIGSNDIGLDRGQLGNTRVVKFVRSGPKILLVQPNYGYRAVSDNDEERKSVEQAFAQSVLWGFESRCPDRLEGYYRYNAILNERCTWCESEIVKNQTGQLSN